MGQRYERTGAGPDPAGPAAGARTDDDRAQDAWKALDRGEDPTETPPPGEPATPPADPPPAGPGGRRL